MMEKLVSGEEVSKAIKYLKVNERPGPYGFSALYYKTFIDILSPVLANTFNSLLDNHSFRRETLTAIICILPKPHTDDSIWSNYRPISI